MKNLRLFSFSTQGGARSRKGNGKRTRFAHIKKKDRKKSPFLVTVRRFVSFLKKTLGDAHVNRAPL